MPQQDTKSDARPHAAGEHSGTAGESLEPPRPTDDYIGLTAAAQQSPGRPSPSCVWRWCRNGVKTRDGGRVRLKHIRVGGKMFTRRAWLEAFWAALAERDTAYFDAKAGAGSDLPPRDVAYGPPTRRSRQTTLAPVNAALVRKREAIAEELEREGL